LASGFLERLIQRKYQVCVIDPEGEYGNFDDVISIGDQKRPPRIQEVLDLLKDPRVSVSINLLGTPLHDRPAFFSQLLPSLQAMRAHTGRPHWMLIDEAHHLLPMEFEAAPLALPQRWGETLFLTVHPDRMASAVLSWMNVVVAVGKDPQDTFSRFAAALQLAPPQLADQPQEKDEAMIWHPEQAAPPSVLKVISGQTERIRHYRKYAEGNLGPNSFYFRGPRGKQNLRAQNLAIFSQISEGIDDETWLHHLSQGDYSRWFREAIKDENLANEAESIEGRKDLPPIETKRLVSEAIKHRYTLPP
jgi:hypothetical protein